MTYTAHQELVELHNRLDDADHGSTVCLRGIVGSTRTRHESMLLHLCLLCAGHLRVIEDVNDPNLNSQNPQSGPAACPATQATSTRKTKPDNP